MNKINAIVSSTIKVTLITFFIKFLGIIKQSILASYCGANENTDIFFIATGILINLCGVIFSAISISLLTIHTERLIEKGRKSANELINAVLRVFIPISVILMCAFGLWSNFFAKIFAPSYNYEQLAVLSKYIKVMSVAFVPWCYYLTINVVLETDKEFIPGKGQGFFQNVLLIFSAVFLFEKYGIDSLVYAFLFSGVLECILVTFCARKRFKLLLGKIDERIAIARLIDVAVPLILGSSIYEINDIVDKQISTTLGAGNASYLNYGASINEIVTGVIIASVSTVLFSHFATWIAENEVEKVEASLERTLEYLTILILPIAMMCFITGDQIVEILYGRGNFGQKEIFETYRVVIGYSMGFVFQATRVNLVKVFYAFQDTKTPMINGIISVGINIIFSFLLSAFWGIMGVALATSIAMLMATVLLMKKIKRYLPAFSLTNVLVECKKGLLSAFVAMIFVIVVRRILCFNIFVDFAIEGTICAITYVVLLNTLKSNAVATVLDIMRK